MRFLATCFALLALSGCASTVNLEPAAESNDPACAAVMVRLPSQLGDLQQRYTNAQATAAWGDPAAVLFRCGLEPVEVSTLPCVSAAGVDWLVDESLAPSYRFISYARFPAVEVVVDSNSASGITSLEALAAAVSQLPASRSCLTP